MPPAGWLPFQGIFRYTGTKKEVLPMTMGQRIAQKRKEQGLSQEGLGEQLGVSRQAIYKWESGAAVPEIDKLIALSRLFGVSVGWLLGVEDPGPEDTGDNTAEAGSGVSPSPAELTDAQLKMVEEIVERYTAALPKPLSSRRRRTLKLAMILGAVCLVGVLYGLFGRLDQLDDQYGNLQSNIIQVQNSVDNQIGSVSNRVEEILKAQNSLVADYGVELLAVNPAHNTATFSVYVVPKTYVNGMTVEFIAENGTTASDRVASAGEDGSNQRFSGTISIELTDNITVSSLFVSPDGTRSTQLLEQFSGLYSDTLPAVDLMCYDSGELLGLQVDPSGLVTLPEVYMTTRPNVSTDGDPELIEQSAVKAVQMGLFKNKTLIAWLEPCDKPERFQGDYENESFYHLPEGTTAMLAKDTDQLQFAAVITDVYGRQAVYSDIPYILSDGELTWPSTADLRDHDPASWDYGQ